MHQAQSVNIKRLTSGCHNFHCIRQNVNIKHLHVHVMISIASERLSISKQLLVHVMISIASDFSVFLHVLKHVDGLSTYPRTWSYFGLLLCPYCLGWHNKRITCKSGAAKSYPQGGWRKKKSVHPNLELNNHTKTIVGSKNHSLTLWNSRIIPKRWQETKTILPHLKKLNNHTQKIAGNKNHTSTFEQAQWPYEKDSWKQKPCFLHLKMLKNCTQKTAGNRKPYFCIWRSSTIIPRRWLETKSTLLHLKKPTHHT